MAWLANSVPLGLYHLGRLGDLLTLLCTALRCFVLPLPSTAEAAHPKVWVWSS